MSPIFEAGHLFGPHFIHQSLANSSRKKDRHVNEAYKLETALLAVKLKYLKVVQSVQKIISAIPLFFFHLVYIPLKTSFSFQLTCLIIFSML